MMQYKLTWWPVWTVISSNTSPEDEGPSWRFWWRSFLPFRLHLISPCTSSCLHPHLNLLLIFSPSFFLSCSFYSYLSFTVNEHSPSIFFSCWVTYQQETWQTELPVYIFWYLCFIFGTRRRGCHGGGECHRGPANCHISPDPPECHWWLSVWVWHWCCLWCDDTDKVGVLLFGVLVFCSYILFSYSVVLSRFWSCSWLFNCSYLIALTQFFYYYYLAGRSLSGVSYGSLLFTLLFTINHVSFVIYISFITFCTGRSLSWVQCGMSW